MPINPVEVIAHIRAGRLRALAVASDKRFPLLPDVPTAAEAGLAGYEASVWWGLVAPAKTPPEIVRQLNAETNKALAESRDREQAGRARRRRHAGYARPVRCVHQVADGTLVGRHQVRRHQA